MSLPGLTFQFADERPTGLGLRSDRTGLIALTERGPVERPTLVQSEDEFAVQFGEPVSGMLGPLAASGFFANGGRDLVVARMAPLGEVGGEPLAREATGNLTLAHYSGAGARALTAAARDPGAFGNRITITVRGVVRRRLRGVVEAAAQVRVAVGHAETGDVTLRARVATSVHSDWSRVAGVVEDGSGQLVSFADAGVLAGQEGSAVLVEIFESTFGVEIRERDQRSVVMGLDVRNLPAANALLADTSVQFRHLDPPLPDPASAPAELPLPGQTLVLSEGSDGLGVTGSGAESALAASFRRALSALEASSIPDILIAPDLHARVFRSKGVEQLAFSSQVAERLSDELVLSAQRSRDRIVIVDPPLGTDDKPLGVRDLEQWRAAREGALADARDFAVTYSPWIRIVTGTVFKGDNTLLVPPSAHVAGRMAATALQRGPWIATGNVPLEGAVGLSERLSETDAARLQDVGINPLRDTLPQGVTIQGVRSLSFPDRKPWRFINTRRLFNFLRRALHTVGLSFTFESNTPATWLTLRREITRLLADMFRAGAFAGARPSEAYFVKVDAELNDQQARDTGTLTAQVGVAPAAPLEFLSVTLVIGRGFVDVSQEPILL